MRCHYNSHTKRLTPPPFQCHRLPALVCANFVSFTLQVHSFRKVHFASQQRWYQVISPTQNNVANFDFQNVDASFLLQLQFIGTPACQDNKSFQPNPAYSCLGFKKLFNVFLSWIGRKASWPTRNIETFPSKHMYLYLSLVERKVAEFYHNMDRRHYLVWLKWHIFITFSRKLLVSLHHVCTVKFRMKENDAFIITHF